MTFVGKLSSPITPISVGGTIQIKVFVRYPQSTLSNDLANVSVVKKNKCIPIIGSQYTGDPPTSNINGSPNAAPPNPSPVRTKPVHTKINPINIRSKVSNPI